MCSSQRFVERVVVDVAVQVGQPVGQPVEHRVIDGFAALGDRLTSPRDQLVEGDVVAGYPHDRTLQHFAALQAVQRPEGHLASQVPSDAEDDQDIGGRTVAFGQAGTST